MHEGCDSIDWWGMLIEQDMQNHSDEILHKLVEALLETFEGLLRKEQVGEEVSQSEENPYQSWNQ